MSLNTLPLRIVAKELDEQLQETFKEHLTSFFKKADKDNSGQLTMKELKIALRKEGYKGADKKIDSFFNAADTSGDREISFEEYLEVMLGAPFAAHSKARLRRVFSLFDKDNSGKIDKREIMQVFREMGKVVPEEDVKGMIALADKTNSGAIDYEGFITLIMEQTDE